MSGPVCAGCGAAGEWRSPAEPGRLPPEWCWLPTDTDNAPHACEMPYCEGCAEAECVSVSLAPVDCRLLLEGWCMGEVAGCEVCAA